MSADKRWVLIKGITMFMTSLNALEETVVYDPYLDQID